MRSISTAAGKGSKEYTPVTASDAVSGGEIRMLG